MKLQSLSKIGVVAAALCLAGVVSAQTATKDVTVSVSLTSQCRVATASAGAMTLSFPAYTAFSAAAVDATPELTVNFECTRGLGATPTFEWDGSTASGVLAGLRYELTTTNGTAVAGDAPVIATPGDIGTPDVYPVTIGGSLPAGQAGTDTSGAATELRTLTVTF